MQECLRSALSSIRSHRMRSFLTMLGVIIGVASVICIVSLLQGLTTFGHGRVPEHRRQHVADPRGDDA